MPSVCRSAPGAQANSSKSKNGIPVWVWVIVGVTLLLPIMCCGVPAMFLKMRIDGGKPVPIAVTLKAAMPPGQFPPLGSPERTFDSGVKSYFVHVSGNPVIPGQQMRMRVFVPAGEHAARSLPCVLIAPAGTPMLHGVVLQPDDGYTDETLPYAEAGFVVVQYSLDGGLAAGAEMADENEMTGLIGKAYPAFKASGAGVVNGRNALEFASKSLNMVDPDRISCVGHSSAGALALLLAAHEPRIDRCVAFNAAYDLESRMGDITSNIVMKTIFPGIDEFITETSPSNHVATIDCPVLVFHARDDSNVPIADAEAFVAKLKLANKAVTYETTPNGDHYQSMIEPGIPTAITWLKAD